VRHGAGRKGKYGTPDAVWLNSQAYLANGFLKAAGRVGIVGAIDMEDMHGINI
jgi:hypothetical protein